MFRRTTAQLCAIGLASLCLRGAWAQTPAAAQVTRLIVPAAAGGATDQIARALAQRLSAAWSTPVVVDNRPGANQIIGAEAVAKASPDGRTLLVTDSSTLVINPHLYNRLPYDALRDFTPVAAVASASPVIAVSAGVDARSLQEFIGLARRQPGKLSYGSMGTGSYAHVASAQMARLAGIELIHVPYKGSSPAIADLLAGNISLFIGGTSGVGPHLHSGKVRILATATSARLRQYPDVPTAAEAGLPGFQAGTWFGVVGPAGMDPARLAQLHADITAIVRSPEFNDSFLSTMGLEPMGRGAGEFAELIRTDLARWKGLVAASGATLD